MLVVLNMDKVTYRPNRKVVRKKESEALNSLMSSFVVKSLFLMLSFFLFYNILHSIKITSQKLDILDRAEVEVNTLRVKNLKLGLKLEEMKEVSYLEVEARDRLNFSGENEIVFVVPDSLMEKSQESLDLILNDSCSQGDLSTIEVWKEWLI